MKACKIFQLHKPNLDDFEFIQDRCDIDNDKKIIEKAKTIYKVIDKNSNSSLVEMRPITGRKHQLRKQLFNIGHSIYGDKKYNSSLFTKGINKDNEKKATRTLNKLIIDFDRIPIELINNFKETNEFLKY